MENFILRTHYGVTFLVCEPLEKAGFLNAFSTRLIDDQSQLNEFTLGHKSPEQQIRVAANRQQFKNAIGAQEWTLITARQIHSAEIRSIQNRNEALLEPQAGDALTANLSRVLLGIQTADCLPILIVDQRTGAFAGVHAGWRGTWQEIAAHTIERLKEIYNSRPEDLQAALGPAICAENFEIGPEVIEQFCSKFSYAEKFISNRKANGKGHLDLNGINRQQLIEAGLQAEKIYDSGFCTVAKNDLFFSYRKELGAERSVGRLLSVVGRSD